MQKELARMTNPEDLRCDLLLAVDCLFNESLVKPFVRTLNSIEATVVVVVSELRSADVLTLFLHEWLSSGAWQVYRACKWDDETDAASRGDPAKPLLRSNLVVWVGWTSPTPATYR